MTIEELGDEVNEDLNGLIQKVSSGADGYCVHFTCDDYRDPKSRRRFRLRFSDVAEATATPSFSTNIFVEDESPLLWDHNLEQCSIYFSSSPANPDEIVGRLYEVHSQLFRGMRELSRYLHANCESLLGGYGLLAEGPRNVMEEYANAIGNRLQISMVTARKPSTRYRVVLFDACFVVCRSVEAVELPKGE